MQAHLITPKYKETHMNTKCNQIKYTSLQFPIIRPWCITQQIRFVLHLSYTNKRSFCEPKHSIWLTMADKKDWWLILPRYNCNKLCPQYNGQIWLRFQDTSILIASWKHSQICGTKLRYGLEQQQLTQSYRMGCQSPISTIIDSHPIR